MFALNDNNVNQVCAEGYIYICLHQVFNGSLKPQGKAMPEWSDCEGKTMQRREDFELAPGWEWASEWKISPISISDLDEEREELQEEIFEYQSKRPSSFWPIDYSESKWSNSVRENVRLIPASTL